MTVTNITYMPNTQKHSGVSGLPTQLMVIHSGECPLKPGFAQSLTNWGNIPENQGGPQASWHWFSDPIAIVSMVDPMLAAWHASEANPMSEGFEQAGYARFSRDEWLTDDGHKSIDNLAWILAQRMRANDIPHRWLTTEEVTAVTTYGNRSLKGLCTHRQIDPDTRYDPGDNFPYDYLDERIRVHLGTTTEQDEEMGILDEEITRTGGGPLDGKPTTLRAVIANFDANVHYTREAIKANVAATVEAMLTTKIGREGGPTGVTDLASTLAYLDANLDKLDTKQLLDPEAIKSAVSDAARESLKGISLTLSNVEVSK